MPNPHDEPTTPPTLELVPNPGKVNELIQWEGTGYHYDPLPNAHVVGPNYDQTYWVGIVNGTELSGGFMVSEPGTYTVEILEAPKHGNKPYAVVSTATVEVTV